MVRARAEFLGSGAYEPIASALADALTSGPSGIMAWPAFTVGSRTDSSPGTDPHPEPDPTPEFDLPRGAGSPSDHPVVADLGGGTGWYAAYLLDRLPGLDGVLLDASTAAAKVAARAHPRLSVATADVWSSLPLGTGTCSAALVIFAPRNAAEIERVLVPGGLCCVVTPLPEHLGELRATVPLLDIDPDKDPRLERQFSAFSSYGQRDVVFTLRLDVPALTNLIAMGPNAFHLSIEQIRELAASTGPIDVTAATRIHLFVRRGL